MNPCEKTVRQEGVLYNKVMCDLEVSLELLCATFQIFLCVVCVFLLYVEVIIFVSGTLYLSAIEASCMYGFLFVIIPRMIICFVYDLRKM